MFAFVIAISIMSGGLTHHFYYYGEPQREDRSECAARAGEQASAFAETLKANVTEPDQFSITAICSRANWEM